MEAEAAEEFFEAIVTASPLRVLVTSRERPKWATARRVLYGELSEIDRDGLAFTHPEARRVLPGDRPVATELVRVAAGWPAVLGLAAVTDHAHLPDEMPAELYDYFAEELFDRVPHSMQRRVFELSLVPSLDERLARKLFGTEAGDVLRTATELGFLAWSGAGWSIHPLLESFLTRRFRLEDLSLDDLVAEIGGVLIREGRWDDAFSLARRFSVFELLEDLIEVSLAHLLAEGRVATVARWLESGRASGRESAILDLAEAEVALRAGDHNRAEPLAARAGQRLRPSHRARSAAWLAAGRSAHLADRDETALHYLEQARRHAVTNDDLYEVLWMELLVYVDLEREGAALLLGELEALPHQRPEHELRIVAARAFLVDHTHSVARGAEYLAAAEGLVERVADPMVRSSFLNRFAYDLAMTARYGEALAVAKRCQADAVDARLEFVAAHVALLLAVIHLGLRHFRESALHANRALEAARALDDVHVAANAHAVRARNLLCQGRAADALMATSHRPERAASRSAVGELIATHGLALACTGDRVSAASAAAEADALTTGLETKVMSRCVLAICALLAESRDAETAVHEAFEIATQTGALDPFVVAYRAYPPLLSAVARDESRRGVLYGVVRRARDQAVAGRIGLVARDRSAAGGPLTRREQQVYELLREGLTNRQIAQTLVISESTAKVHVRHILEKYGVRSRTEAAVARIKEN